MSEETARQAADRWLEYGQSREDRAHREDAFEQAQVYATFAVADEIAKLREAVEREHSDRPCAICGTRPSSIGVGERPAPVESEEKNA